MHDILKKNVLIVVALALPLFLITGVFVFSKFQSSQVHTEYDFVYATCDSEWYGDCPEYLGLVYKVENERITIDENATLYVDNNYDGFRETNRPRPTMRMFYYDSQTDIARELLPTEAQNLVMDARLTSPDGVVVEGGSSGSGMDIFLFDIGSSYSYDYYFRKGSQKRIINLTLVGERYYYGNNFKFLGWVLN